MHNKPKLYRLISGRWHVEDDDTTNPSGPTFLGSLFYTMLGLITAALAAAGVIMAGPNVLAPVLVVIVGLLCIVVIVGSILVIASIVHDNRVAHYNRYC